MEFSRKTGLNSICIQTNIQHDLLVKFFACKLNEIRGIIIFIAQQSIESWHPIKLNFESKQIARNYTNFQKEDDHKIDLTCHPNKVFDNISLK